MAEAVGDQQAPVPVVMGVGLGVARHQVDRGFNVARLIGDAQVELEVGPVVGKRVEDLLEGVCQAHDALKPSRYKARKLAVAMLEPMATVDTDRTLAEYDALTERCGLLDRSERGKLALTGSGAVEFLNGQVTNELADLHPGDGRYAAFLTHKGKMLGDLRILAVGEGSKTPSGEPDSDARPSELLLDTERVALQALFDMIRRFKVGYDVELHKRTVECSLFSLIGPRSREVAAVALGIDPRAFLDVAQASLTHTDRPRSFPIWSTRTWLHPSQDAPCA